MDEYDEILQPNSSLTPRRIAGLYLLFGLLWIVISDFVLFWLSNSSSVHLFTESTKGILFVLFSGGLLYILMYRARRDRRQAHEKLQRQTRELSIFHRIVRHNLRNIATVIVGRVDVAQRDSDPTPHLAIIDEKGQRLSKLAEKAGLLREVSAQQTSACVTEDLSARIQSITDSFREQYPDASITVDVPNSFETAVPERLGFAISELIENAVVHAGPDPSVSVSLSFDDSTVRITVFDDGPGIPDAERTAIEGDMEGVFEHSEGVGLWLSRLIVENAGGAIEITDDGASGTTLSLTFPRRDTQSTESSGLSLGS